MSALATAPRLLRLGVAGCRLGPDGGRVMIDAMAAGRGSFRLEELDLSFNSLGAGIGEALERSLRQNETLTRLGLRYALVGRDRTLTSLDNTIPGRPCYLTADPCVVV